MNKPGLALALVLWMALAAGSWAAEDEAQTVAGFRVPEYDENNQLKSQLFGDFDRVAVGPDGVRPYAPDTVYGEQGGDRNARVLPFADRTRTVRGG